MNPAGNRTPVLLLTMSPKILKLPDGSPSGDELVVLMGTVIGELCDDLSLQMDVAGAGNLLMVYDPLHLIQERRAEIRSELLTKQDPMVARLVWFSFYGSYDGP